MALRFVTSQAFLFIKTFNLLSVIAPTEGETYDSTLPTKQTELLCLSLRRILSDMAGTEQDVGLTVTQTVASDFDEMIGVADATGTLFEGFFQNLDTEGELPEVPDLGTWLTAIIPLIPALLKGGSPLYSILIAVAPRVLECILYLIRDRISKAPVTDLSSIEDSLENIDTSLSDGLVGREQSDGYGTGLTEMLRCALYQINPVNEKYEIPNLPALRSLLELCLKDETTPYLYYINQAINDHKDVIELIDEKIDSMNRLLEELEQARAIAIMRTTEVDKIVYIDS